MRSLSVGGLKTPNDFTAYSTMILDSQKVFAQILDWGELGIFC